MVGFHGLVSFRTRKVLHVGLGVVHQGVDDTRETVGLGTADVDTLRVFSRSMPEELQKLLRHVVTLLVVALLLHVVDEIVICICVIICLGGKLKKLDLL